MMVVYRVGHETPPSALRAARLRAGLSQVQLAAKAGIALATISNAERAPEMLSDRTARRVARVLGVAPEQLRGCALLDGATPHVKGAR
jgi:transcriptional regulator with XRE-family HTH domain